MATDRSIKDKRYEEKHKEERKAKYMIWGTSVCQATRPTYSRRIHRPSIDGNDGQTSELLAND